MTEEARTGSLPGGEPEREGSIRIFAPGAEIGSRYEVRRVLGRGGSAVVYGVFDRELRRDVALKVLRSDRMDEAALKRFRREAAVARDADSPLLARVFDIGRVGETVFLTMEEVVGESLRDRLARGPLPEEEAVALASSVLRALAVLHARGVVHRDVKPGNILLPESGGLKLADFGLARRWEGDESRATETDGLVGTVEYLSPEQALGHDVDARTDLYALGVLLFEMLTGRLPFPGRTPLGVLASRLSEPAPDVREVRPRTPAWLASVIARLLEKDPDRRYASAEAVLHDLETHRASRRPFRGAVWRRLAAVGATVAFLAGLGLVAASYARRPRLAQLLPLTSWGAAAVDPRGRTLWTRDDLQPGESAVPLRMAGRPGLDVAAIPRAPFDFDQDRAHRLQVLDGATGRALFEFPLPRGAPDYPDFSPVFKPHRMSAVDLDGDGADEVVVTENHVPYWPCYTMVCEPALRRAWIVWYGSGSHHLLGALDLDGDGRKELILSGLNNRMGWHADFAALRVPPWSASIGRSAAVPAQAFSPDRTRSWAPSPALLWYALGPPPNVPMAGSDVKLDVERRAIRVPVLGGGAFELGLDGFEKGIGGGDVAVRAASRERAYARLRDVTQLSGGGHRAAAVGAAREALSHAEAASDRPLADWARRVLGRTLAADGRVPEAVALFEQASRDPQAGRDAAFDAATAFHLNGDLPLAAEWYRRGLTPGGEAEYGRMKYEFLEGLLFALTEMGRPDEARRRIEEFAAASLLTGIGDLAMYRAYVAWRSGAALPAVARLLPGNTDLFRYWELEVRLASGEDPATLLGLVREDARRASETRVLLQSLEAELLRLTSRGNEALALSREAFEKARVRRELSVADRAHFDLVVERYARAAAGAGRPDEAARARAAWTAVAWRPVPRSPRS